MAQQKKESNDYLGTVLWFSDTLGYGFIECGDFGTNNVYVHWSRIVSNEGYKTLSKGECVRFEVSKTTKGFQAVNVREDKIIKATVTMVSQ
jgi:cold shock protein